MYQIGRCAVPGFLAAYFRRVTLRNHGFPNSTLYMHRDPQLVGFEVAVCPWKPRGSSPLCRAVGTVLAQPFHRLRRRLYRVRDCGSNDLAGKVPQMSAGRPKDGQLQGKQHAAGEAKKINLDRWREVDVVSLLDHLPKLLVHTEVTDIVRKGTGWQLRQLAINHKALSGGRSFGHQLRNVSVDVPWVVSG